MVWPTVQVFNFYCLPPYLRVVYVCTISSIYDAFLSFMKYEVNFCFNPYVTAMIFWHKNVQHKKISSQIVYSILLHLFAAFEARL